MGDVTGMTNPLSIVKDTDKTITAVFIPDGRDPDHDGLSNYQEIVVDHTNPNVADIRVNPRDRKEDRQND